jgi:hypothetical protein
MRHRNAVPAFGAIPREVDAEALVEPILDPFVEQDEKLRVEDDPRRIAVM